MRADPLGETAAPWRGPLPPARLLAVHAAAPGRIAVRCAGGALVELPGATGWRWASLPAPAAALDSAAPLTRARGGAGPALRLWAAPALDWRGVPLPPGARLVGLPPRPLLRGPLRWSPPRLPRWRITVQTLRGTEGEEGWEGVLVAVAEG